MSLTADRIVTCFNRISAAAAANTGLDAAEPPVSLDASTGSPEFTGELLYSDNSLAEETETTDAAAFYQLATLYLFNFHFEYIISLRPIWRMRAKQLQSNLIRSPCNKS